MLTTNEKMVLTAIMKGSNFTQDSIDITKTWAEQKLEDMWHEKYWAFADVKSFSCGLGNEATRAIFGSLVKKSLIHVWKDDDAKVSWLTIDEECFNNIKQELGC